VTPKGRLRVGQIGAGCGAQLYLRALVDSPHVGDVYLAEPDEAARQALVRPWGVIKRDVADYAELLAEPSVDVIHLSVPPAQAPELALAALAAGKPVILQGPPAPSLRAWDAVVRAAEAAGLPLLVGMPQLAHPALLRARELSEDGEIGSLLLGRCLIAGADALVADGCEHPEQDAQHFAALYQGAYVLQYVLGPAATVLAESAPESAAALLTHGDAVLGEIAVTTEEDGAGAQEVSLVGREGMLLAREAPDDELPLLLTRGHETTPIPVPLPLTVAPWLATRMMAGCLDALVHGHEPPVPLADVRAALATALACLDSAQLGHRVRIL
jgi:predicted dehydrogenase